jgi:4a-hydroxytetrahydrobiopterin dehydratase
MPGKPRLISAEILVARLKRDLPGWTLENGWLRREFATGGWGTTLMLVNAIGFISEAADHHPDLEVSWGAVRVKLQTHASGGVTERDFALAKELERLALWKPAKGSGLEGAPDPWVSVPKQ